MASSSSSASSAQDLVPPINFSLVCPGVYRSGYPTKKNYPFLRALRLRSILYLCPEEYAETNLKFCEENGISVLRFPTEGNKEPFTDISELLMHRIVSALTDTRNHPVLIHCNKGKHRTGAVCGCLRLLQGWSLVSIFREYKAFSGNKARVSDQTYIELYYPIVKITPPHVARWLAVTPRAKIVFTDRELEEAETVQIGSSLLAPVPKPEKASKKKKQQAEADMAAAAAASASASPATTSVGAAAAIAGSPAASTTATTAGSPSSAASMTPAPGGAAAGAASAGTSTAATNATAGVAADPPSSPSGAKRATAGTSGGGGGGGGGGGAGVPLAPGKVLVHDSNWANGNIGGNPLTSPATAAERVARTTGKE